MVNDLLQAGLAFSRLLRGSKNASATLGLARHLKPKKFGEPFWGCDCGKSSALANTTKSGAKAYYSTQVFTLENGRCFDMSKFPSPLASSLGDVEFSRLSADEIKRVSVKRIHVTPTFDSLGGPAPGGLYDPALGAVRALDTT
jgi:hypothetical protein